MKPQFKMGGKFRCFNMDYGVGDLREGFSLDMSMKAKAKAEVSGQSIEELNGAIKKALVDKAAAAGMSLDTGALGTAVDKVGGILSTSASTGGSQVGKIAASVGINVEDFKLALEDKNPTSPMVLKVTAFTGFGVNIKLALGLLDDLEGYRMVGVAHKMTVGVALGGDVFAGRHCSGTSVKIVIGIGNFSFEYTLPVNPDAKQEASPEPRSSSQESKSPRADDIDRAAGGAA